MLRSLVWKEWREQRLVAKGGLFTAVIMPLLLLTGLAMSGADQRLEEVVTMLPIANWVLLWPLAAVATAAAAISPELRDARLAFLLSRPVPRRTIMTVKLTVAAVVAVAIIAAGQGMAAATAYLFDGVGTSAPELLDSNLSSMDPLLTHGVVAFAVLCFAMAALLSLVLRRAMQVVAVAALSAAALFGANLMLWWRIDYYPLVGAYMTLWPAALAAVLIVATFVLFERGELLRGVAHSRQVATVGVAVLLAWGGATTALAAWEMRAPSNELVFGSLAAAENGSALAVTVARADRAASQTVGIMDGEGNLELIDRRLTTNPALSPDGRYLAYVGMAGAWGLRSDALSLYVHDRQTGEERLLARISAAAFDDPGMPVFSADSRYVAASIHGSLVIADVDGGRPFRAVERPRGAMGVWLCHLAGWDVTSGHVLDACNSGRSQDIRWIDPDDGTEIGRVVAEGEPDEWFQTWPPRRMTTLLVRTPGVLQGWAVLDLATRSRAPLFESDDGSVDRVRVSSEITADGRWTGIVAYTKTLPGTAPERRQIRLRRLATGQDLLIGEHVSNYIDLELSPGGLRLLARVYVLGDGAAEHVVSQFAYDVDRGTSRELRREPVFGSSGPSAAWMGDGRLVYLADFPSRNVARSERTLADVALLGWSREIRVLDLVTDEEPIWSQLR